MTDPNVKRAFELAEASFDRAAASSAKTGKAVSRADTVFQRIDQRDGLARAAARRERKRLNAGLGKLAANSALIALAIFAITVVVGLIRPIGMFGFLGAVLLAVVLIGAMLTRGNRAAVPAKPAPDLPTGALVDRLDSYLYRARPALPAPAQFEIDRLLGVLPELKPTLERIDALDPAAQDARRLMGTHLPNLIDRYLNVPPAYRATSEEDVSVDQRLVDALRAGREALDDVGKRLAKGDVAAFETQGRFIESRYGEQTIDR